MCLRNVVGALLLVGLASAAPNPQVDFDKYFKYVVMAPEDKLEMTSYLQTAAEALDATDAETLDTVVAKINHDLGNIFMAYKNLSQTAQFRDFVAVASHDELFEQNLQYSLRESVFKQVDDLDLTIARLSAALVPELNTQFGEVFSSGEAQNLLRLVKGAINKLEVDHYETIAMHALRIVLLDNAVKYTPTTTETIQTPDNRSITTTHPSSVGSADQLHKCVWLLAFTIFSQILF